MRSLYVHIPFCKKKCFYCSFVIAAQRQGDVPRYLDCLRREASFCKNRDVETVYIGGGTPTLLSIDQLKKMMGLIKENFVSDLLFFPSHTNHGQVMAMKIQEYSK